MERGAGSWEHGAGSWELGAGSMERGAWSWEHGAGVDAVSLVRTLSSLIIALRLVQRRLEEGGLMVLWRSPGFSEPEWPIVLVAAGSLTATGLRRRPRYSE
jgi:hypothetical protein